ncbi:MAG: hypothetical protein NTX55_01380 [Candidatus Parcubacteria bacterium]|nr:hypothetical protein [Candidatus Parcubacteria bacterium]
MLRIIILIIIIVAVLSYFNFDVKKFFESDIVKNNFGFVWNWVSYVWENYLRGPLDYFWNDVFINLIWNSFIENLQRFKAGQSPNFVK